MPEIMSLLFEPELPAAALLIGLIIGTFISEDAACVLAANAVASGRLSFAAAAAACFIGIFAGDLMLYGAGRLFGKTVFEARIFRKIRKSPRLIRAQNRLNKNVAAAVFSSRFISGLRLPMYLLAGVLRVDLKKFAACLAIAGAIWVPTIIATVAWYQGSVFAGQNVLGIISAFILVRLAVKYSRWENRRLLVGKFRRLTNWEFWPVQVFYIPVVVYVLLQAIKYRSLTVFTSANPGILAGGFKGESKNEIYNSLRSSRIAADSMLKYAYLSGEGPFDRVNNALQFVSRNGIDYPIVLKPDAGERGRGVTIVNNEAELESTIHKSNKPLIVQEFAAGIEASVFYTRRPNKPRGEIFSITEKQFPVVIGDGESTLRKLILHDKRSVCLAESYFHQNEDKLTSILQNGESVRLIEIGTHSRGAIFVEGDWIRTPQLESRIDEICGSIPGFHFGRFDLKAESFDALQRGEFKIIELNGVTSESTNIYDPRYSLAHAYRILFEQWRLAFEIGDANRKNGAPATAIADLFRLACGKQPRPVPVNSSAAAAAKF